MRVFALLVLLASPALADRRELVLQLEGGLGVQCLTDASTTSSSAIGLGPSGQLSLFYGLTNSFHLGIYGRGFYAPDIAFPNVTPTLPDGSRPSGTLYENALGFGGGLLARWRFDTGYSIAPFVQLELGASWAHFSSLQLIPTGRDFGLELPSRDVFGPDGRAVIGAEYRVGEHILISLLFGVRRTLNAVSQFQFDAGLAAGFVW